MTHFASIRCGGMCRRLIGCIMTARRHTSAYVGLVMAERQYEWCPSPLHVTQFASIGSTGMRSAFSWCQRIVMATPATVAGLAVIKRQNQWQPGIIGMAATAHIGGYWMVGRLIGSGMTAGCITIGFCGQTVIKGPDNLQPVTGHMTQFTAIAGNRRMVSTFVCYCMATGHGTTGAWHYSTVIKRQYQNQPVRMSVA